MWKIWSLFNLLSVCVFLYTRLVTDNPSCTHAHILVHFVCKHVQTYKWMFSILCMLGLVLYFFFYYACKNLLKITLQFLKTKIHFFGGLMTPSMNPIKEDFNCYYTCRGWLFHMLGGLVKGWKGTPDGWEFSIYTPNFLCSLIKNKQSSAKIFTHFWFYFIINFDFILVFVLHIWENNSIFKLWVLNTIYFLSYEKNCVFGLAYSYLYIPGTKVAILLYTLMIGCLLITLLCAVLVLDDSLIHVLN